MRWNYASVTHVACGDPGHIEFVPTISAIIGDFAPQRSIWRICVCLETGQRLLDAVLYYAFFSRCRTIPTAGAATAPEKSARTEPCRPRRGFGVAGVFWFGSWRLNDAKLVLALAEQGCLLLLTGFSSADDLSMHELGFGGFAACSAAHQVVTVALMMRAGPDALSPAHRASYIWKVRAMVAHLISGVFVVLFFVRHVQHCENYVYSLFAMAEWVFVLSNICFHCSAYIDFRNLRLELCFGDGIGASVGTADPSTFKSV